MLTNDRRLRDRDRPTLAIFLCWIAASLFLLLITASRIAENSLPDADDAVRLEQVRGLLASHGWFEPTSYGTQAIAGAGGAWSRLPDLPLAGLILLLARFMDMALAERVAMVALPLLVLLLAMLVVGRLSWRLFDRPTAACACLVAILLPGMALQFQPLRIDHHGWQVLAVLIAAWALAWREPGRGGTAAGLAMAIGLTLSLDLAVLATAFGLVLALRWLRDHRERWWLVSYLQALALGLAVLFALTRGLTAVAPLCNAISPPQLGLVLIMALGGGALAVLPALPRLPLALAWAALAGLGIGFVALAAPQCLVPAAGKSAAMLPGIWPGPSDDAGPLWRESIIVVMPALAQMLLAVGVSLYLASIHRDWQRAWWFEYALLMVVAVGTGAMAARTLGFAGALSALPIGWFVARILKRWRAHDGVMPRLALGSVLVLVLVPGALMMLARQF